MDLIAKDKAKELVEQFNCGGLETFAGHNVKVISKKCALIAVDEILKVSLSYAGRDYDYYQEVKKELEKLCQ